MTEPSRVLLNGWKLALFTAALTGLAACQPAPSTAPEQTASPSESAPQPAEKLDFALAIHGGAGVIPKDMEPEVVEQHYAGLRAALTHGRDRLAAGASSLDVVEEVVRMLEDDPLFNAGKGAVFTHEGTNELDAAIMDGRDLNCGAITGVTTVRNPVSLARKVMEESRHIFFAGDGAEAFADEVGVERVEPEYFFVQRRYDAWQKLKAERAAEEAAKAEKHGTVGAVALDKEGNLAAATSTGGLTDKRFGRIGDVPVIGAGTYANNKTAAVSCTGWGEKFIRNNVAHDVSARMAYLGVSVQEAAKAVIHETLDPNDGGLISVSHSGEIAMEFNTPGMFRGAADSTGRFEVGIWEETRGE